MRVVLLIIALALVAACGASPAASAPQVAQALQAAGASNIQDVELPQDAPVPRSFTAHQGFEIASVAPKGGQLFICDTKQNCDAIFAYYDALKGLAGPYLYRSPSGTVVVQLNSGLKPDEAAKFEAAVKGLP